MAQLVIKTQAWWYDPLIMTVALDAIDIYQWQTSHFWQLISMPLSWVGAIYHGITVVFWICKRCQKAFKMENDLPIDIYEW